MHVVAQPILDARGEAVALVTSAEDVGRQRQLEQHAAELADRLTIALEAGGLGTWQWDMATGLTEWDARLEQLFGLRPGEFDGTFDAWVSLLHPDDAAATLQTLQDAVAKKTSYVVEHRVFWPDGSVHWLQGKGHVTVDESGNVTGTIGCTADVTEQMLLALEREELTHAAVAAAENERLGRERLEFLGTVNEALARSTTREEVMRNVTRAAVPRLGDWCAIFVLPTPEATVPDIELAHVDPAVLRRTRQILEKFPYDPAAERGVAGVMRTARSELSHDIAAQILERGNEATEEAREVVRSLGLRSGIAVPILKRGRVLGAMQFVNTYSQRPYTDDDVALAEAVANRIGSTLENIRLSEGQRRIATTLQASLLPETLPDIPGIDIAVRYWAAGEGTEVGGDFYDVFEVAADAYAVVIGDVCGTGPEAASLTGLARHTIRAAAWQGAENGEVLRLLNNAILRSGRSTFCTALFGILVPREEGFDFGISSGGHPLPIICRPGERARTTGAPGTLLGLVPEARSTTEWTRLLPGDIVVLYTDGATDVRPPYDLPPDALEALVDRAATDEGSAAHVADRLGHELSTILPISERNDDIALLVLSVGPI